MASVPLTQTLGALFLLWLHLCACGGYYEDNEVSAYEFTEPPQSASVDDAFLEKSPSSLSKRPPRANAPTGGRGGSEEGVEGASRLHHAEERRYEDIMTDNRIRSSGGPPTGDLWEAPTTQSTRRATLRTASKAKNGVFPQTARVCKGEDVIYRMWGVMGTLRNCTVVIQKNFVQLYPPPASDGQKSNESRIVYFDYGVVGERCGFRIRGAQLADYGTWHLTAVTDKENLTSSFGLSVVVCPGNGTEKQYTRLPGENSRADCGPSEAKVCYVMAPGESRAHATPRAIQVGTCSTPSVPFSNLVAGEWACNWACPGSMLQRSSWADIEYAALPSDQDVGVEWRNTSSPTGGRKPSVDLRCNYFGILDICRFVQPGGGTFYPKDGLALGRYSYFGRGVISGDCGLSVEQPLEAEDIGLWRCEAILNGKQPWNVRGGFLEVGIVKRTREEKLRTLRAWGHRGDHHLSTTDGGSEEVVEVLAGDPVVIGCSADAPLTLCLIRQPNGNASAPPRGNTPDDAPFQEYGRGVRLGDCGLQVRAAEANHTGRWECVVGIDYGDAHVVPVKVLVHEKPLLASVEGEVSRGLPVNFSCRSILGVSLEHCRFERPDRSIVTVMDSRHPDLHRASWRHGVRAVGNLSAGVCTVSIPSLRAEDVGEWTCVAKAQDTKEDFQLQFRVEERGISAASIGAVSAVVVILIVLLAVGCFVNHKGYFRQRRMNARDPTNQESAREDSVISFRRDDDEDATSQTS